VRPCYMDANPQYVARAGGAATDATPQYCQATEAGGIHRGDGVGYSPSRTIFILISSLERVREPRPGACVYPAPMRRKRVALCCDCTRVRVLLHCSVIVSANCSQMQWPARACIAVLMRALATHTRCSEATRRGPW
jgi:hypothetical protein